MSDNKDVLPETITEFKRFFTKEEEAHFRSLWSKTMNAIGRFEQEPYSDFAFRPVVEGSYPRGQVCEIDFTTLGVAIFQVNKEIPNEARLKNSLKTLPQNLDELKESLFVFLSEDKELTRQTIYQEAIDYIDNVRRILK